VRTRRTHLNLEFAHAQAVGVATGDGAVGGQGNAAVVAQGGGRIQLDAVGADQFVVRRWHDAEAVAATDAGHAHASAPSCHASAHATAHIAIRIGAAVGVAVLKLNGRFHFRGQRLR